MLVKVKWNELLNTLSVKEIVNGIEETNKKYQEPNLIIVNSLIAFKQIINNNEYQNGNKGTICFSIVRAICDAINDPLSPQLTEKLVRIMYFIIQYFLDQKMLKEVALLSEYVLPYYTLASTEPSLIKTYRSMAVLLRNHTVKSIQEVKKSNDIKILIKTSLQFQKCVANLDPESIIEYFKLSFYYQNLLILNPDAKEIYHEILKILYLTDLAINNPPEIFQYLIQMHYLYSTLEYEECYPGLRKLFRKFKLDTFIQALTIMEEVSVIFKSFKIEIDFYNRIESALTNWPRSVIKPWVGNMLLLINHLFLANSATYRTSDNNALNQIVDVLLIIAKNNSEVIHSAQTYVQALKLYVICLIKNNSNHLKVESIFKTVINLIEPLKSTDPTNYNTLLFNSTAAYYNFCIKFFVTNTSDTLRMVLTLNSVLNSSTISEKLLPKVFTLLSSIYYDLNDHERAGEVLIVFGIVFKDISLLKLWFRLKLPEKSFVGMVLNNQKNLLKIYPELKFDLVEVAFLELQLYYTYWPEKTPMLNACRYVCVNGKGDLCLEALKMCWQIGISETDELWSKMLGIMDDLRYKSKNGSVEHKLNLAILYVLKYVSLTNKGRQITLTNILRTLSDPKDQSDNSYKSCTITQEHEIIQNLHAATKIFKEIKPKVISKITLDVLQTLPYYYELHKYQLEHIQTTFLCYQYAEIMEDSQLQLIMLTIILDKLHCKKLSQKLIEIGNELCKKVQNPETELKFLLAQSSCLFKRKEYQRGYELLEEVDLKYKKGAKNSSIAIWIDRLRLWYYRLPCSFGIENHKSMLLHALHSILFAINCLKKLGKENLFTNETLVCTTHLFDLLEEIGGMYLSLRLLRDALCYTTNVTSLARALSLPLRTAQFLCLQSKVEIANGQNEQAQLHLHEMLEILSVNTEKISINGKFNLDEFYENHLSECQCNICSNTSCLRIIFEIRLIESEFQEISNIDNLYDQMLHKYNKITNQVKMTIFSLEFQEFESVINNLRYELEILFSEFKYVKTKRKPEEIEKAILDLSKLPGSNHDLISNIIESYLMSTYQPTPPPQPKLKVIKTPPKLKLTEDLETTNIFVTPLVKPNRFFKSRTPITTPAPPAFKIYTPICEKKSMKKMETLHLPPKSPSYHDADRLLTPYKFSPEPPRTREKKSARKKLLQTDIEAKKVVKLFDTGNQLDKNIDEDLTKSFAALDFSTQTSELLESARKVSAKVKSASSRTAKITRAHTIDATTKPDENSCDSNEKLNGIKSTRVKPKRTKISLKQISKTDNSLTEESKEIVKATSRVVKARARPEDKLLNGVNSKVSTTSSSATRTRARRNVQGI